MVLILIIIAIIAAVYISNLHDDKVANHTASFASAFISHAVLHTGQKGNYMELHLQKGDTIDVLQKSGYDLVGYENSSGVKYVDADGLEQISDELFIVYNAEGIGFGNKDWKSECLSITITFS